MLKTTSKMKVALLSVLAATIATSPANIGDTALELRKRYGTEGQHLSPGRGLEFFQFDHPDGDEGITVIVQDGKCIYEKHTGKAYHFDPKAPGDNVNGPTLDLLKKLSPSWTKPMVLGESRIWTATGVTAVSLPDGLHVYGNAWSKHFLRTQPHFVDPDKISAAAEAVGRMR